MKYIYFLLIFILSGCTTPSNFNGPGTFQDFANTRYQCLQETSVRQIDVSVNKVQGTASETFMPTCSTFYACLASKGYYYNEKGQFSDEGIKISCVSQ